MLCEIYANDKFQIFPLYYEYQQKKQDYKNSVAFNYTVYTSVNAKIYLSK